MRLLRALVEAFVEAGIELLDRLDAPGTDLECDEAEIVCEDEAQRDGVDRFYGRL